MSHTSQGTILKSRDGKYVRVYQTQTHVGTRDFVQLTPDINCATIFRSSMYDIRQRKAAEQEYQDLVELKVEITRTITILQDGDQPCLPL